MTDTEINIPKEDEDQLKIATYVSLENVMDSQHVDFTNIIEMIENPAKGSHLELAMKHQVVTVKKEPLNTVRYNRYDQEVFMDNVDDLDIDSGMSYINSFTNFGIELKCDPIPAKKKCVENRNIVPTSLSLRPPPPPPPPKKIKASKKSPIIIIPPAGNMDGTLINMYNARDILESLMFRPPEERRVQGAKRELSIYIHRNREGKTVPYKIIDDPSRMPKEDWKRVVAVFVMGPQWQFKSWHIYNGDPVGVFSRIPAFHIYYEGHEICRNITKWNVNLIPISRDKQHLNPARLKNFWEIVDLHITKHKKELFGQD